MRAVLALATAIVAGGLTLVLVVATTLWIDDPSSLGTQFFVGYILVGLVIGAASAWVARRALTASVVAVVVVLLSYWADIPDNLIHVAPRVLATFVATGVAIALVLRLRTPHGA